MLQTKLKKCQFFFENVLNSKMFLLIIGKHVKSIKMLEFSNNSNFFITLKINQNIPIKLFLTLNQVYIMI